VEKGGDFKNLNEVGEPLLVKRRFDFIDFGEEVKCVYGWEMDPKLGSLTKDGADLIAESFALLPGGKVQNFNFSGGGVKDPCEHFNGGRFASSIGANKGNSLAGLDGEREVSNGGDFFCFALKKAFEGSPYARGALAKGEDFGEIFDRDDGMHAEDDKRGEENCIEKNNS
jgi:hypothetical protein